MPTLLIPVFCPECQTLALFLWCRDTEAFCGKCRARKPSRDLVAEGFKILISPQRGADGHWIHGDNITFYGLRAFIDDCLDIVTRSYRWELLSEDTLVIQQFLEALEASVSQSQNLADDETTQERAVRRLRRRFEMWMNGELPFLLVDEVPWVILEPAGDGWRIIERYANRLQKIRNHRYDWERLNYLNSLKPDKIICGLGEFEGYLVFVFTACDTAVMECAQVGHAIYIVKADRWESLSRLSRTALLQCFPSDEVEVIPHMGNRWEGWLAGALRRRGILPPLRGLETTAIVRGDFRSLRDVLSTGWIEESDLGELEHALRDEPVIPSRGLGVGVSAWISKMIAKAGEGMWHVPPVMADELLTKALSRYYGLSE